MSRFVLAVVLIVLALVQAGQSTSKQLGEQEARLLASENMQFGGGDYLPSSQLLAENLISGQNSKRARKMSAFMPMRGRKDGRDQRNLESFLQDQQPLYLDTVDRELDLDSPSILRLIAADNNANNRQFANQLAARHLLLNPEQLYAEAAGSGEQMMQAKLRRAFHPMRGKKSSLPEVGFEVQTD